MKKITPLSLVIIIGCIMVILVSVYFIQTGSPPEQKNSTPSAPTPAVTSPQPGTWQSIAPADPGTSGSNIKGPLIVSIGDYNAKLPVLVDGESVGEVSQGKPLNISVNEGYHAVKVCTGEVCEQVGVEVKSAIKTTIDFGDRLKRDAPQGLLSVSIGNYTSKMQLYIDNSSAGEVSPGKLLTMSAGVGRHMIKVCAGTLCKQQDVLITSTQKTTVDFEEQLLKDIPKGSLTVSIGGFDAELPVFIDDTSVGVAAFGKPLSLMVNEGRHTVKVCVGVLCENESVDIKFAQYVFVDFGPRLKKDVEFSTPTVRIVGSVLNVNRLTVSVEFINPDKTDHTMSATIGCGYSYIDSGSHERKNEFAQSVVTRSMKAGTRIKQSVDLSMSRGSAVIASEPSVVEMVVT